MLFLSRLDSDPLRPFFLFSSCHESDRVREAAEAPPPTSTQWRLAASNPEGRQAGSQPPYIFYAEGREFLEKRSPPPFF
jgi:hypothetical protein